MVGQTKIKVNSLTELNELLEKYHWPAEMILPVQAFNLIFERVQPAHRGSEYGSEFVMVSGVKIMPPKCSRRTGKVDLSNAEVL